MKNKFKGIHHITAMAKDIKENHKFMTEVLGMKLVKKTVNQDDIDTYHTFYADDLGNAGTDMTFFDFQGNINGVHGTNEISRAGLRVKNDEALKYWYDRFEKLGIKHGEIEEEFSRKILKFEENDGQRYKLISDENDEGVEAGVPFKGSDVPEEYAIIGLGTTDIRVSYYDKFKELMIELFDFKLIEEIKEDERVGLFEIGLGGNGGRIILKEDTKSNQAIQGDGTIHHIAFRVKNREELEYWINKLNDLEIRNSGYVNRYYFESLYVRIGHILFEVATDGPGFMQDESYETMGEKLSLPPFLEPKREEIEKQVRPFNTKR